MHRCNGKIFDRTEDGDIDITNHTNDVAALYERKRQTYSESRIYKYVTIKNLREDLIMRVRKAASIQKPNHPWSMMNDMELLKSAGLYLKDFRTGEEGFTLVAILLFGRDEVINSVIPYHRTDAILRRKNIDRYDDRDDIRTNLIESYDRLMAFVSKHLPDKFYLEKDQRINVRDAIFREVTSNLLIHREYMNPYPAKLIIGANEIVTENSNKPHGYGKIDPNNFSPFPKNPLIAKVFKEMGLVDELGSGVRNIYKYCKIYFGSEPSLLEEDIFKIIMPINAQDNAQDNVQDNAQEANYNSIELRLEEILKFCAIPRTRQEIQHHLNFTHREYFRKKFLKPLIDSGRLKMTLPDKPNSRNQKYYSVSDDKE